MKLVGRLALALLLWTAASVAAASAQPGMEPLDQAVCRLIERAAGANHLPVGYLTRIIWRESSFRPGVVSPAGAEGIAQFMPGTAQQRGLADPFDPEQAIPKAAHLLADLRRQFGSLGAAAAAYNAGPGRVSSWLQGQGDLPAVTRAYVRFVTREAIEPGAAEPSTPHEAPHAAASPPAETCLAVTAELRRDRGRGDVEPGIDAAFAPWAPWGVQLAGNFSKALALASFERARHRYSAVVGEIRPMIIGRLLRSRGTRPFYQVRLPAASRQEAQSLCYRIQSVGGSCVAIHS